MVEEKMKMQQEPWRSLLTAWTRPREQWSCQRWSNTSQRDRQSFCMRHCVCLKRKTHFIFHHLFHRTHRNRHVCRSGGLERNTPSCPMAIPPCLVEASGNTKLQVGHTITCANFQRCDAHGARVGRRHICTQHLTCLLLRELNACCQMTRTTSCDAITTREDFADIGSCQGKLCLNPFVLVGQCCDVLFRQTGK